MNNTDQMIRLITLFLDVFVWSIWQIGSFLSHKRMPKEKIDGDFNVYVEKWIHWILSFVLGAQLLGASVLLISPNPFFLQITGLVIVSMGTVICIISRVQLGKNWVSALEYQVKKEQQLITNGIYAYIRHPIYLGIVLMFIGGELVAKSYLVIIAFFIFYWAYIQGKREEALLLKHFGKRYIDYMQRTKMFIPFIF